MSSIIIKEALECFDKALNINPNDAEAWDHKGEALYRDGNSEEAMKCYNKSLKTGS